jgi:hypothetical protein
VKRREFLRSAALASAGATINLPAFSFEHDSAGDKEFHKKRLRKPYRVLFNDDGFCTYSNASRYQDIRKPVGLAQVHGYVDEVADSGCDVILLCPNLYQIPGWDSAHDPYWRSKGRTVVYPDTAVGKVLSRAREFLLAGNDLVQLSLDRARQRGLAFFLTWRMNECHGIDDPRSPGSSDFYLGHPEYYIQNNPRYGKPGEKTKRWDLLALDFSHGEVREHQIGFIKELCDRYPIDGLELDFLRFPFYFPTAMPFEEKAPIMTEYLRSVRRHLDSSGKDIPIGARLWGRLDMVHDMGLDLDTCVREGLIDILNLSSFYVMTSELDIEAFRKRYPHTPIYGEMTQSTFFGKGLELSVEQSRKATTEILRSTAYSLLDRGADGVSLFNFVYYRDYSFGSPNKIDKTEPNFPAIRGICDRAKLAAEEKHYFITRLILPFSRQLPAQLTSGAQVELRLYVADALSKQSVRDQFQKAVLRVMSWDRPWTGRKVEAYCGDAQLEETVHEGELFPQPYKECIPANHTLYRDFVAPVKLLRHGYNTFRFVLTQGEPIKVDRLELALYGRVSKPRT